MDKFIKFGIIAFLSSFISLQAAEFESNVALSSEYMWRGMTQSDGQAAVSGGLVALLAGIITTIFCMILVPVLSKIGSRDKLSKK